MNFFVKGNGASETTPFPPMEDEVSEWKSHIRLIFGEKTNLLANFKIQCNDGSIMSFEDILFDLENVNAAACNDLVWKDICKHKERNDAYRYAKVSLQKMVAMFVVYAGKQITNGYPMMSISPESKKVFQTMSMKMVRLIQALVIAIGPEDLCNEIKCTLVIFYVYVVGMLLKHSLEQINSMLHSIWVMLLKKEITNDNFCVPVCRGLNDIPESLRFILHFKRPGSKSFEDHHYQDRDIYDVILTVYDNFTFFEKGIMNVYTKKLAEKAKLEREKAKAKRKKEELERRKKEEERLEKVKEERKKKKQLYRKNNLAKAKLEEAQRQQGIESNLRLRLDRYYEKVRKEQEERKLLRHKLNAPHVMSPSRKREEKIRRREQQEDSHSIWRAQKRKHRNARK